MKLFISLFPGIYLLLTFFILLHAEKVLNFIL